MLPSMPVRAASLVGIETGGFGMNQPYIEGIDGQIYSLDFSEVWQADKWRSGLDEGTDCQEWLFQLIEVEAGPLKECRTVQVLGEWCPGPRVSFAITAGGEVWRLVQPRSCNRGLSICLAIGFPVALLTGLSLVLLRRVIIYSDRKSRLDHDQQ
jgi:hypothetical protein